MTPRTARHLRAGQVVRVHGLCEFWVPGTVVRVTTSYASGRAEERVVVSVACTDGVYRDVPVDAGQVEVTE